MSHSSPDDFSGTERFAVRRRLGAGGMGVVYEAVDLHRNMVVALKTIGHFDPSALYNFKKEFRALEDVTHPNLVRLWELFSEGDHWFFTMELVAGVDFLQYVRPAPGQADCADRGMAEIPGLGSGLARTDSIETVPPPSACGNGQSPGTVVAPSPQDPVHDPSGWTTVVDRMPTITVDSSEVNGVPAECPPGLDVPRLRSALGQLASGLAALHTMGKLHRDVKPSNVMVGWDGRVVVLDFGVAAELRGQGDPDATERQIVGTFAYMAPEQAAGRPLDPSSDWYAVGAMLYQALTGRLPHSGSWLEVIARKQTADPLPPSSLVDGLPSDLCDLCVNLLRREPGQRPTGEEILRRLGVQGGEARPSVGLREPQGQPFLGRESQMAALREALGAARRGRTVTTFVRGRSGSGKSSLIGNFLGEIQGQGDLVILEGRCFEQESVAYKAVDALIDSLSRYLRRLDRLEAEAILPRDIAPLARVFPVLSRIEAVANCPRRGSETSDQQELRRRAFAALRELLGRIGDRRALILHVDDLQWGDVDSADLLVELLRPPDAPVLLMLCCYRSEYERSSPCLLRLLGGIGEEVPGTERRQIEVDAMTPGEARDLARLLLSRFGPAFEPLVEMIAHESGGSPFFVNELTRYMAEGGELEEDGSISLDDVLWRRIRHLPAGARRLLEAIAVAGQPIPQSRACRAAGLGPDGYSALALLRSNNLVRGRGAGVLEEVEAYHDRIREAVERRLSPADLASWHRLLADELEDSGADPETLAVHFERGGKPAKACRYFAQAAANAAKALAFSRAASLYRRVLELWPPADPHDQSVRIGLAEALANAGLGSEAAEMFLEAASEARVEEAHDLQARAAYQFLISGRIDEGLAAFNGVLARVGLPRPGSPQHALYLLLRERLILAIRGLGFSPREPARIPPADLARVDVARAVAVGISVVDVIQGSYFQSRSLRLALQAGDPLRVALSLGWEAVHSACQGPPARRRTARLIALANEVACKVGHPHALGMAALSSGASNYMSGRFTEAVPFLDRAEQLFRDECTGVVWELDTSQVFGLWNRIYQGDIAEVSRRFRALYQEAKNRGDRYMESTLGTYPGAIALLADDTPAEARDLVDQSIARWSQHGFHVQHLTHCYGHIYIDLYEGDGPAAWARSERTWPAIRAALLHRIHHVNVDVLQLRGRGAVAAAAVATDPAPLLAAAEGFARKLGGPNMTWGVIPSMLIRAGVASIRGDSARAVALLAESVARAEADRLGLFAAAARWQLGRLVGGDAGCSHVARAEAWMADQAIRSPRRMADCLVPGFTER